MKKKEIGSSVILFILLYAVFIIINTIKGSKWLIIDNLVAIISILAIFYLRKWLMIGVKGFILFNIALLLHNLGAFGFYSLTWKIFAYDNLVHFVSSVVAALILFNFIARKLYIKKYKKTIVNEYKVVIIFLVISSVVMFGMVIELAEFSGFVNFDSDEIARGGFLNVDAEGTQAAKEYLDTMEDVITNILGAIIGTTLYYFFQYKKKPWIRYK